jgi:hypothetical protein
MYTSLNYSSYVPLINTFLLIDCDFVISWVSFIFHI